MRSRGATDATIDGALKGLLAKIRQRVDPDYERMFHCSGGCEDTGWVVVDDGIASTGKRVRAAVVRRCSKCGGRSSARTTEVTGGSFS